MHGLITKQIASVSILPLCFVVSSILHSQNTLFSSTLKKKKIQSFKADESSRRKSLLSELF